MRTPAPVRSPLGSVGQNGVIIVSPAWQEWFQRLADYYDNVPKYIDPGSQYFGQAEPTNLAEGLIAYADGVNWNPGSGIGYYRYNNGVWTYLSASLADIAIELTFAVNQSAINDLTRRIENLEKKVALEG